MEKKTDRALNELLIKTFNGMLNMEERAIITDEFNDITNNDMHIIEAVGIGDLRRMSEIAGKLGVTVGTLTTNMNSLEKKGYIRRKRSEADKRVVLAFLTDKGKKAFFHHRDFHKKMIKSIMKGLYEDEMKAIIKGLTNLDGFLNGIEEEKRSSS